MLDASGSGKVYDLYHDEVCNSIAVQTKGMYLIMGNLSSISVQISTAGGHR